MLLIYLSAAWITGIWLGYYLDLPPVLILAGLIPVAGVFFTRRYRKMLALAGLGVIIIALGAGYAYESLYRVDESKVRFYNDNGALEIKGIVAKSPDIRDKSINLTLTIKEIYIEGSWRELGGNVLVTAPRYPVYSYGDYLLLKGELRTPVSSGDFDYQNYLAHQGINSTLSFPAIEVVNTGRGFKPLAWIYTLRSGLAEALAKALPEPQAALAQGIVLGIRSNIPADLQRDFSVSGTTHLLAISGMNIGIMAGILLGIAVWLLGRRRYIYILAVLGAVWFYAIITGLNPPVIRGAVMASIFLVAEGMGRQRSGMVALLVTAAAMVGVHPYVLGDVPFQLSFLAMAGLIFIFPIIQKAGRKLVVERVGEKGAVAGILNLAVDTLGATLASMLAIWPALAYYFGFVSVAGPLATFLAMPAIPLIIVFGTLTGIIGLFWTFGAQIIAWPAWLFLTYFVKIAHGLAAPSLAAIKIGGIHPAIVIVYYLVLAGLIWLYGRWKLHRPDAGTAGRLKAGLDISFKLFGKTQALIAPLLLAAMLVVYTAATLPDNDLRVSFLDVGEGDAVFIRQGTRQILVDGGPSPKSITLALSQEMPFWDRSIDLVVLTHPHQDHLAGLVEVLRRYQVGRVIYTDTGYATPMEEEFERLIAAKGIEIIRAQAGMRIVFGDGVEIKVLSPLETLFNGTDSDVDNNSVALRVSYDEASFVLTGDIMSEAEHELIRNGAEVSAAVMKAAHHGSDTSTTAAFLAVVKPKAAVISSGAGNKYGLPEAVVVNRLEERVGRGNVFRTDVQGTIKFVTDGKRLWVETEKSR